jgi:hypothetical protein
MYIQRNGPKRNRKPTEGVEVNTSWHLSGHSIVITENQSVVSADVHIWWPWPPQMHLYPQVQLRVRLTMRCSCTDM